MITRPYNKIFWNTTWYRILHNFYVEAILRLFRTRPGTNSLREFVYTRFLEHTSHTHTSQKHHTIALYIIIMIAERNAPPKKQLHVKHKKRERYSSCFETRERQKQRERKRRPNKQTKPKHFEQTMDVTNTPPASPPLLLVAFSRFCVTSCLSPIIASNSFLSIVI